MTSWLFDELYERRAS